MWVNNQRNKGTTIREERKKRLDSIGFTWKLRATPISVDWEVRFQELVDCKQVHGNCDVSQGYKANKALGIWVTTQRTKEETIREERKKGSTPLVLLGRFGITFLFLGNSVSSNLWITNEFTAIATYHKATNRIRHLGFG
mmetsp:Transcript_15046/g.22315  ORF Transcript_15046/g.22315 Transcript_15046/m.22315 type:complete len:140 (-) Transcript_15046:2028-2447(-)